MTKPGYYEVSIMLANAPIRGSPFTVLVEAARSALSWADGAGLEGGQSEFGSVFTIHGVDIEGNPRTDGGDPFEVNITGPSTVTPKITDNNDGKGSISLKAQTLYLAEECRYLHCRLLADGAR